MHKCVKCGKTFEDNDEGIVRGCNSCGSIFFLFTKGQADESAGRLEEVKSELRSKNLSFESELVKAIERKKADENVASEDAGGVGDVASSESVGHVEDGKIDFGWQEHGGQKDDMAKKIADQLKSEGRRQPVAARPHGRSTTVKEGQKKPEVEVPGKQMVTIGKTNYAVEDLFGIETVRMPKDGVFQINIDALMKKRPVIVLEKGGIYIIQLPQAFENERKEPK
jgi:predicted  nucleic acid-binding Zn-ribbon protein